MFSLFIFRQLLGQYTEQENVVDAKDCNINRLRLLYILVILSLFFIFHFVFYVFLMYFQIIIGTIYRTGDCWCKRLQHKWALIIWFPKIGTLFLWILCSNIRSYFFVVFLKCIFKNFFLFLMRGRRMESREREGGGGGDIIFFNIFILAFFIVKH